MQNEERKELVRMLKEFRNENQAIKMAMQMKQNYDNEADEEKKALITLISDMKRENETLKSLMWSHRERIIASNSCQPRPDSSSASRDRSKLIE